FRRVLFRSEAAMRLQHAAAGRKPVVGEGVVGREARELVPIVVDAVDAAIVGAEQLVVELEIVRRVGEDEIDACRRQALQRLDAIADDDSVQRELRPHRFPHTHATAHAYATPEAWPCCATTVKAALTPRLAWALSRGKRRRGR